MKNLLFSLCLVSLVHPEVHTFNRTWTTTTFPNETNTIVEPLVFSIPQVPLRQGIELTVKLQTAFTTGIENLSDVKQNFEIGLGDDGASLMVVWDANQNGVLDETTDITLVTVKHDALYLGTARLLPFDGCVDWSGKSGLLLPEEIMFTETVINITDSNFQKELNANPQTIFLVSRTKINITSDNKDFTEATRAEFRAWFQTRYY